MVDIEWATKIVDTVCTVILTVIALAPLISGKRLRKKGAAALSGVRVLIAAVLIAVAVSGVCYARVKILDILQQGTKMSMDFETLKRQFPQPQWVGRVGLDLNRNEIFIHPERKDERNPSYIRSTTLLTTSTGYRLRICCRIVSGLTGGFQIALPGGLTVQAGDGTLGEYTVKIGDYYLDEHGQQQGKDRKSGLVAHAPCLLGDPYIVIVQYDGSDLIVSDGPDGTHEIIRMHIDQGRLGDMTCHDLSLRSYGAEVAFSQVQCVTCTAE